MQAHLEIDSDALRANCRALRAHVGASRFAAVIKANAYGHGLEIVASALQDSADAFGVYEISEAVALRELGITQPIHILGPTPPQEFDAAIAAEATLSLWNGSSWLRDLIKASQKLQKQARVQLKIETGLTRLGVDPHRAQTLLSIAQGSPELVVTGAYSHLASAEELDSQMTLEQLSRFHAALPAHAVPERHIAASAAAILWPQTRLDLVRVGIALYGIWPSPATQRHCTPALELRPVLQWKSALIAVREVEAETPLGYGSTYRPPMATRIGILPIGYAEGLPRALSNVGEALVAGVRCPIVGRVCMNMSFIDIGAAPSAHVGSIVTLIGSDGDLEISAEDVGRAADTIGYEIVARLPPHIPRRLIEKETR